MLRSRPWGNNNRKQQPRKHNEKHHRPLSARCCFHELSVLPSLSSKLSSWLGLIHVVACAKRTDCQDNLGRPRFLCNRTGCKEFGLKVSCLMRSPLGLRAILPNRTNWLWSSLSDKCLDFAISRTVLFVIREIHEGGTLRILRKHLQ